IDLNATLGLDGAQTKQTIKAFIEDLYTISTETLIGIVAYNDKVRTLGLRTFEEQDEVYQFIDGLSTNGTYSGMYESCLRAVDILDGTVFRGAKNLILFTDEGDETTIGAILKEEVLKARVARRVVALDGTLFTEKDHQEMTELAQSPENYRFVADQTGLANAFTDLADQMRQTDRFVFERPGDFVDRPRLIRFTFSLR
ncbi:MAG: vWA domain-containing protein, partial [Bacteroidota bacterium]